MSEATDTVETGTDTGLPTRDEAIRYLIELLSTLIIDSGAELAEFVGPEMAAALTVQAIGQSKTALRVLGVSQDDLERVFADLERPVSFDPFNDLV